MTLTGVVSLVSVVTVPLLMAWSANWFMGRAAPDIDVTALALAMFAITAVPVAIGVAIRHFAGALATRIEPMVMRIATVLFIIIVIGALAANWSLFITNLAVLGPLLVVLNIVLLAVGMGFARILGLDRGDSIAVAMETGIQNSTLGITVGSLIVEAAQGGCRPSACPPASTASPCISCHCPSSFGCGRGEPDRRDHSGVKTRSSSGSPLENGSATSSSQAASGIGQLPHSTV